MTIIETGISLWERLKSLGIGEDVRKNAVIELTNQVTLLGGFVCILMTGIALYIGLDIIYAILALLLGLSLFSILILNAIHQFHISRFIIAGVIPLFVSIDIVLIGGSFGEECILLVLLFLIYILYENEYQKRNWFYFALVASYLGATIYLFIYPPVFSFINNPYDNLFAFVVSAILLLMIIWLYQKESIGQQQTQDILIEELKLKNANLEKTTEELEQFTYIASHDLKSPLRTIISFLDLIKRDVNRQQYDDLLSKIDFAKGGAEQMNFLVTDILEYSKIKNETKSKKRMVSLQSVAEKVKVNLTSLIQKRKVELYVFPLPDFYCNETEMTVLFQNFIENGIKYNEETTPTIFVKSRMEENQFTLQFIDNGIGIEEEYFEKIFQFFKRLHTSEVYQGTGLGLGLCHKIITGMNGTVSVESMMNVGSTFTIRLPILTEAEEGLKSQPALEVRR